MNKLFIVVSVLVLTACASNSPTGQPSFIFEQPEELRPTKTPASTEEVTFDDPIQAAVARQLAGNLGLKINEIALVSDTVVEFSDACLGVSMPDVMCAQVITPGRILVFKAGDFEYEYHTNADGNSIVPATLALTWQREGGIAGFCDNLTVYLSGEVYGNHCKSQEGRLGTFASLLSPSEQVQFFTWAADYGRLTLDASDPRGVSDQMKVTVDFYGTGQGKPDKSAEAEIFNWAQTLYQKLNR